MRQVESAPQRYAEKISVNNWWDGQRVLSSYAYHWRKLQAVPQIYYIIIGHQMASIFKGVSLIFCAKKLITDIPYCKSQSNHHCFSVCNYLVTDWRDHHDHTNRQYLPFVMFGRSPTRSGGSDTQHGWAREHRHLRGGHRNVAHHWDAILGNILFDLNRILKSESRNWDFFTVVVDNFLLRRTFSIIFDFCT